MRPAPDAVVIDTSDATPDAIATRLIELLRPRRRGRFYVVLRLLLSALLHTAFRLEVIGADNIPERGGVILAPNHRSLIDHPVVRRVPGSPWATRP
jgi:1-acyl-sn-glycerol-3-phosphate acyltransferase